MRTVKGKLHNQNTPFIIKCIQERCTRHYREIDYLANEMQTGSRPPFGIFLAFNRRL